MDDYVEIRCPNLPFQESKDDTQVDHSEVVCGNILGGIPTTLIENNKFNLLFHCQCCKMFWQVSFCDGSLPVFFHISDKIKFVRMTDFFGLIEIEGRKLKKRKEYAG